LHSLPFSRGERIQKYISEVVHFSKHDHFLELTVLIKLWYINGLSDILTIKFKQSEKYIELFQASIIDYVY
jgi:hypothetical protein